MKKQWRWLGWVPGIIILALILIHIGRSPQWKGFEWSRLWFLLIHVHLGLLLMAVALDYFALFLRAFRWRFFVDPIKKCSIGPLFRAQVIGFSAIYLVGRTAEIVRPAYIAKAENLPFTSQLAVWVLERVYDSGMLVILFALSLYFTPLHLKSPHSAVLLHRMHQASMAVLAFSAALVLLLGAYRVYSGRVLVWLDRTLPPAPSKVRRHTLGFMRSFSSGLQVIKNPWDFFASIACSLLLWANNVTIVWLALISIGGRLAGFPWWGAGLTVFLAAVGLAVQLPGVGGGYQVAILLALRDVFHMPAAAAASGAILTWVTVMAPCLLLGLILVLRGGLTFKKIRTIVEEEEREAATSGE